MDPDRSVFSAGSLAAHLLAMLPRSRAIRHRVDRGAIVFRQGAPATTVFLVEIGRVRLTRVLADGARLVLYVAEAGECFAEASLSAAHYHCDAAADIDAVVLALPKADVLAALAADPGDCLALALSLASQVRDLRGRLELRNIRSAPERVLAWLRLNATGSSPRVRLRGTWTQVADELGLSREAVYRSLAQLEQQGQISRDKQEISLTTTPGAV